jgi:lipopolysaccharide export LptBFGC system permease protein LptF
MSRLTNQHPSDDVNQLRFMAKSVGILALLTGLIYLRVVGVDSVNAIRTGQWGQNIVILFFLMMVATLGLLCAWRLEAVGGVMALVSGLGVGILTYLTFEQNRLFTTFAYSSPFLVAGGLSLACWWRGRERK